MRAHVPFIVQNYEKKNNLFYIFSFYFRHNSDKTSSLSAFSVREDFKDPNDFKDLKAFKVVKGCQTYIASIWSA